MPIRITRVYTRTGDRGETALVGGKRVPKDAARIEAYGTVDELNAALGLARAFNAERLAEGEGHRWLDETLRRLQNELFDLGSELATPEDAVYEGMHRIGDTEVTELERLIDHCQKELPPLKSFVLPGGGRIGAALHQARTICRWHIRSSLICRRFECRMWRGGDGTAIAFMSLCSMHAPRARPVHGAQGDRSCIPDS